MNETMTVLLFRALYSRLGLLENARWRRFRRDWLFSKRTDGRCEMCGDEVWFWADRNKNLDPMKRATLDHIIPKYYIFKFGWIDLLYDEDNFELMCKACNVNKGFAFPRELSTDLMEKLQQAANSSDLTPKSIRDRL